MAAFNHVTQNVLANSNITKALREDGIKEIGVFIILSDAQVEDLTYLDSDSNNPVAYRHKKWEIGLIKSFIHLCITVMKLVIQLEMIGAVLPKMSLISFAAIPSTRDPLHHLQSLK
jgi:hypothetical protein